MIDCKYAVACGACDTCMGTPDPAVLWQDLADALNALEAAGLNPSCPSDDQQITGGDGTFVYWDMTTVWWVVAK